MTRPDWEPPLPRASPPRQRPARPARLRGCEATRLRGYEATRLYPLCPLRPLRPLRPLHHTAHPETPAPRRAEERPFAGERRRLLPPCGRRGVPRPPGTCSFGPRASDELLAICAPAPCCEVGHRTLALASPWSPLPLRQGDKYRTVSERSLTGGDWLFPSLETGRSKPPPPSGAEAWPARRNGTRALPQPRGGARCEPGGRERGAPGTGDHPPPRTAPLSWNVRSDISSPFPRRRAAPSNRSTRRLRLTAATPSPWMTSPGAESSSRTGRPRRSRGTSTLPSTRSSSMASSA